MEHAIRFATPADAEALLDIYRPYVLETAITFEYDVPSADEFRERIENTLHRYPYLVAVRTDGTIDGYAYASAFHPRAAYIHSAEGSIYIRRECRGTGLGRALYVRLEELLIKQGITNLNACIAAARPDNTHLDNSSIAFHEKLGYSMVGCFHKCGLKFGEWYDMVWMEKIIAQHSDDPAPFIAFPELN